MLLEADGRIMALVEQAVAAAREGSKAAIHAMVPRSGSSSTIGSKGLGAREAESAAPIAAAVHKYAA